MAVNTQWVTCLPGEWVQVCELRPTRKALILQLSDGIGVFSYATNGPMVTYNGQEVPAGLPQQVGSGAVLDSGSCLAPTRLELSRELHGELVELAWYAWVYGGSGPPPPPSPVFFLANYQQAFALVYVVPSDVATYGNLLVVAVASINTGPTAPTLTSAAFGPIAQLGEQTLSDGGTDSAIMRLFALTAQAGDTVTIAGGPGDWLAVLIGAGTGVVPDVSGSGAGSGGSLTVAASAPPAGVGELCVACVISYPWNSVENSFTPWPGAASTLGPISSPDGTQWELDIGWTALPSLATPVAVDTFGSPVTGAAGLIQAFTLASPYVPSLAVITVFESFDVVDQSPETFAVPLPTLSPEAIADLQRILAQLDPE